MISSISPVSFKGFDNVTAGRIVSPPLECYVVTARLNNQGVNDLEKFSRILYLTNNKDGMLTIKYQSLDSFGNIPSGSSLDINGFPLILREGKSIQIAHPNNTEKQALPLITNVTDLLKRIIRNPENKNTDVLEKSFENTVKSISGTGNPDPTIKNFIKECLKDDESVNGVKVQQESAENIIYGIDKNMMKYFG